MLPTHRLALFTLVIRDYDEAILVPLFGSRHV